jgi:hypothetical protein
MAYSYLERIRMKNHWIEEKKKFVKIYDNTMNAKTVPAVNRYGGPQTDEEYAGKVPKTDMWTLRAELDEQFWYGRLNRIWYKPREDSDETVYPAHWSLPTQPGQ